MSTAIALSCGHCGAPLNAPTGTRYLTCAHCGSRLEVKRSESAIYTTVLEKIEKQTEEIASDVEVIRLQNDLERLDREWQMERESYLQHHKDGSVSEPSGVASFIGGLFAVGLGIFITLQAPPIGLIVLGLGIWTIIRGIDDASQYEQRKKHYRSQRERLASRIDRKFEL